MKNALFQSDIKSLKLLNRGKVRDIYEVDDQHLLIVTTDRLSAFDVVLPTPVPGKGQVLTAISNFWFDRLQHLIPNQLTGIDPASVVTDHEREQVAGRAIVVKKLKPLPIEAIVRGYLAGSGWKEYKASRSVCGIPLPAGLREADKLPEPLFTPSTKAEAGAHDENISYEKAEALLGTDLAAEVRDVCIALYNEAAAYAATKGIIIADTKFEFGVDEQGTLYLIDEALTPDSSRFWPADQYQPGSNPPSFDKQYVRDWLERCGWNKQAPGPELPPEVAAITGDKYREAFKRLTQNHIEQLLEGFRRFHSDHYEENHALFERLTKHGQSPKTIVVGCCDSRVDPAIVTNSSSGDLFIIRNVANLVPPYEISGSHHGTSAALEFGVCQLEVENIIVLGHARCGGIRALMNQSPGSDSRDGFIDGWMKIARNARNRVLARMQGESPDMQAQACELEAIKVSLDNLLTFPWILERVAQKKLALHGWYFDIERGELLRYNPDSNRFDAFSTSNN
jgi:phosphoribosylaminoimidazole-succinocarboxamide synthase